MTAHDGLVPPIRPASLARTGIDRAAQERADEGLVERLRADAETRVLVLHGDAAPLAGAGSLHYATPADVADGAEWAFLGRSADRAATLAAVFPREADDPLPHASEWASLRAVGGELPAEDSSFFVAALSLGRWLLDAPFCPACGSRTTLHSAGWARHCPNCGREHFPRTDPAVIVGVTSARHPDRLLLGSNALWGVNRFSCFAGFVEAGESLEGGVLREVREESGVQVVDVRYRGSQAWPYPRSLMVGFHATSADDDTAVADGEEIVEVRWFDRAEIVAGLAGTSDLLLPGSASIAHRLITGWLQETA